jgi:hypothetical protein
MDKLILNKIHRYIFLRAFISEIQSNYFVAKQLNLLVNSNAIIINYLNLILFLCALDANNIELLEDPIIVKFKSEILSFSNTYNKDYFLKKNYAFNLQEVNESINYYNYNQLLKATKELSKLVSVFFTTSIESIKLSKIMIPEIIKINSVTNLLEIKITSFFEENQFSLVEKFDEFINNNALRKSQKTDQYQIFIKKFNLKNEINSKDLETNYSSNVLQKNELLSLMPEKVYLANKFIDELKVISKEFNPVKIDFFINLLDFKREPKFRNLLIKNEFEDFNDFLLKHNVNDGVFTYKNFIQSSYYDEAVSNLCKKGLLFQTSGLIYWTREKVLNTAFGNNKFQIFFEKIDRFIDIEGFITTKNIFEIFPNQFYEFPKPELLIESLLMSMIPGKYVNFSLTEGKLYSRKELKLSKIDLLMKYFQKGESHDLYDIINDIQEKFGVVYKDTNILKDIKGSGLYYSDDTEKIYFNKKAFIKEIYQDGSN